MKNKKIYFSVFIIVTISIIFTLYMTFQEKEIKRDSMTVHEKEIKKDSMNNEPQMTLVERTVAERRVEVNIDERFEIDRDQLAFETDKEGKFQATYIITNNVPKEEKRIMYAIVEGDNSPLIMEINGEKTRHHIFTVPNQGEVKVDFTLSGLPNGKRIVYIISEKYIDNKTFDELEIIQSQKVITTNYFSLDVQNINNNNNSVEFGDGFKPVKKIEESHEGDIISLYLYDDQELSTEVSSIERKKYYLLINNYLEFEMKGYLYLFSDYNSEKLEQILVPANSQVVLPVNLENHKAKESIRFLLLGEPTEKPDIQIPVRLMNNSMRIPIK